ncbi:MAG: hypothetical protein R2725_04745 [Solirubrobacterales bacterium]
MTDAEKALAVPVFCAGAYKPFGELTAAEARARSEEIGEAGGWGPLSRAAAVALAWRELAEAMRADGAATVGALDSEATLEFARRLWIVPPRDSLL